MEKANGHLIISQKWSLENENTKTNDALVLSIEDNLKTAVGISFCHYFYVFAFSLEWILSRPCIKKNMQIYKSSEKRKDFRTPL